MHWVMLGSAACFGAIVGSFLNVVSHRYHPETGWDSVMGRSRCANPDCRKPIPWFHNVPVLGWVFLRGRTACCRQRLSVRYPLVEALTALLFLWLAAAAPFGEPLELVRVATPGGVFVEPRWHGEALAVMVLQAAFLALLVVSSDIDLKYRVLPDRLDLPGTALGVLGAFALPGLAGPVPGWVDSAHLASGLSSIVGALAGAGFTYGIRVLGERVFRKPAMGLGDVKFMAMIGAFTGWEGALMAFFVGCLAGAVIGVLMKSLSGDSYIPFGPFLAVGGVAALLHREDLSGFLFTTWPEWQNRIIRESPWIAVLTLVGCLLLLILLVRRGRAH